MLSYPWLLTGYGRVSGLAAELKAGEYEIPAGTTPLGLLQQLVEGRVKLHSLTIVEGWTVRDLMRAMRNNPAIRQTLNGANDEALVRALDLPGRQPEGWFFPDTYRFPRHTTDREILSMAHARMQIVLDQAWAGRQADLPLRNAYEALILASIVEKETALDRERPRIAGVFIRRLEAGMRLQTDPTVIYGLGEEFDGDLTRRQLGKDTPYNTYTRAGSATVADFSAGRKLACWLRFIRTSRKRCISLPAAKRMAAMSFPKTLRDHNAAAEEISRAHESGASEYAGEHFPRPLHHARGHRRRRQVNQSCVCRRLSAPGRKDRDHHAGAGRCANRRAHTRCASRAGREPLPPLTELLLMFAARAAHLVQLIRPELERGHWVVCDRFTDASYAYQGAGRGLPEEAITDLETLVQGDLRPDLTLLLDAAGTPRGAAVTSRGVRDRFEGEGQEFFGRVRAGYLARAQADRLRMKVIDASRPVDSVQADIVAALADFLAASA